MHCNVNALDVHCAHMSASIKSCGTRRQLRGQWAARKEEETELLAWIYLALAAFFEVVFAMAMKYSHGFSRLVPTVIVVVGTVGGIGFLTMALKTLPVSVAWRDDPFFMVKGKGSKERMVPLTQTQTPQL